MYPTLNEYNSTTTMLTSDKKYACPNYVEPGATNYFNYYNLPSSQNTNIEQLPVYRVNQNGNIISNVTSIAENEPETNNSAKNKKTNASQKIVKENLQLSKSLQEPQDLLPILDCDFNLREICKQSILLEDHLLQKEKRCTDCCIKHFLALEALSEEALSLDKEKKSDRIIEILPTKFREIQKKWYMNPNENAHACSQELRHIRKGLMEKCFPVIFQNDAENSCQGNSCSIAK